MSGHPPEHEAPAVADAGATARHHVHQALCHLGAVLQGLGAASLRPAVRTALLDLGARLLWISEELHGGTAHPRDRAVHQQIEGQLRRLPGRPAVPDRRRRYQAADAGALRSRLGAVLLRVALGLLGKAADKTTVRLVRIALQRLCSQSEAHGGGGSAG